MVELDTSVQTTALSITGKRWVAVVGNPNTGKTTLFNALTGMRQRVGNYPGVTVEKKIGIIREGGTEVVLVDLPGCYSIAARSPDEMVAIDVLMGRMPDCQPPDLVVVVLDASNIERNLYLASQLLEIGLPIIICLNMIDMAEAAGITIDTERLSAELGARIVSTSAKSGRGLDELRQSILNPEDFPRPKSLLEYPPLLLEEAKRLCTLFSAKAAESGSAPTYFDCVRMLLEAGGYAENRWTEKLGHSFSETLDASRRHIEAEGYDLAILETHLRYGKIGELLVRHVQVDAGDRVPFSERLDRIFTHRLWGSVTFLLIVGLVFQAIYSWSAPFMDAIDQFFGAINEFVGGILPEGSFQSFLTDGVITGVGAVVIFLPQILLLFLFIAILEDCGYLPRAAFLMDRLLSKGGLSGKSFIPLLSSFACAVPGIMATRVIENRRDRIITMMIAPLMSCSARLPVYTILIGTFIPSVAVLGGLINLQGLVLFLMYCVGAVISIPIALFMRKTAFRNQRNDLIMLELPSYQWPSARNVFMRMYIQGRAFLIRAGTIIFAMCVVVWALTYYPRPQSIAETYEVQKAEVLAPYANIQSFEELPETVQAELQQLENEEAGAYVRQSYLGRMGRTIEPAVRPLGWDWKIGTAVLASFPAREVIIAVLGIIYDLGGEEDEESASLSDRLRSARHPDGRPVYNIPVALSIMIFFALCAQCGSTLATIQRESNSWKWPVFAFSYMTLLAYIGAFLAYHLGMMVLR